MHIALCCFLQFPSTQCNHSFLLPLLTPAVCLQARHPSSAPPSPLPALSIPSVALSLAGSLQASNAATAVLTALVIRDEAAHSADERERTGAKDCDSLGP